MYKTWRRAVLLFFCILILSGVAASCSKAPKVDEKKDDIQKLSVVCTSFSIYDFARNIGGDTVSVTMLLKADDEDGLHEITQADLDIMQKADVLFYAGDESDAWISQSLAQTSSNNRRDVKLADVFNGENYFWMSPKNVPSVIKVISDSLAEVNPEKKTHYEIKSEFYSEQIKTLDEQFEILLQKSKTNKILMFGENSFSMYLNDYGIEVVYINEKNFDDIKKYDIKKILATDIENKQLDDICSKTGAQKVMLRSCYNVSKSEMESDADYIYLMQENIDILNSLFNG